MFMRKKKVLRVIDALANEAADALNSPEAKDWEKYYQGQEDAYMRIYTYIEGFGDKSGYRQYLEAFLKAEGYLAGTEEQEDDTGSTLRWGRAQNG